jgi:hypothetical protein
MFVVSVVCLSGRGLCDGLITRPEESYRMRLFLFLLLSMMMMMTSSSLLLLLLLPLLLFFFLFLLSSLKHATGHKLCSHHTTVPV